MSCVNAVVDCKYIGIEGTRINGVRLYQCMTSALNDAPDNATQPYVILIKQGRYYEKLNVTKPFITFIGEQRDQTVLTFDTASDTKKSDGTTYGTTGSASITVRARDFRAENLTIENSFDYPANAAKPSNDSTRLANAQAVALKTDTGNDRAIFKNINLMGYQDTLYVNAGRHYFTQCCICGKIDFIFGAGQAVFDDCDIVSRDRASATNNGWITAPSTHVSNAFGFLFIHSRLKKEHSTMADHSVALGRPWHPTTRLLDGTRAADPNAVGSVAFIHCWMDSHIAPNGWEPMAGKDKDGNPIWFDPADARFFEFASRGPGASTNDARRSLSEEVARNFTIDHVLSGWNPLTDASVEK